MPGHHQEAPSPLERTILRAAQTAEQTAAGTGQTYLLGLSANLASIPGANGQQMINASTAGKAFSFATGYRLEVVGKSVERCIWFWEHYDSDELAHLLSRQITTKAQVRFGNTEYVLGNDYQ